MTYFNGDIGHQIRLSDGSIKPFVRMSRIYCDACGEIEIPLPARTVENDGRRHWDTGFRWAGHYGGGKTCMKCGTPV